MKKVTDDSYDRIINQDISLSAVQVFLDKPYAWEYKFLACVLKGEVDKLKSYRWDFKYGIHLSQTAFIKGVEILDVISEKLEEIITLTNMFSTLLNTTLQEAIGEPGVPSDLDMVIYVSKRLASIYKQLLELGVYLKSVHTDDLFKNLLSMIGELTGVMADQIDEFIERAYNEIMDIPDVEDGVKRNISLTCVLNVDNTEEINKEIERLTILFN